MLSLAECSRTSLPLAAPRLRGESALRAVERRRSVNYPLSSWYLRPAAGALAWRLSATLVRPWHLSLCGLVAAALAAGAILTLPGASLLPAALVLAYWFFDRADGQLARCQRTASRFGAWLDANIDELVDVGLHLAVAEAAAVAGSSWAWPALVAFLAGKYLLMYGLLVEEHAGDAQGSASLAIAQSESRPKRIVRLLYHAPGNADLRIHLLAAALASGWLTAELVLIAVYYNVRWMVRYALLARRLRGQA